MIKSGVNTEGERAGQEWKHTICDMTSIIVDDGVTLHPGFIEVKDGQLIAHYSDDPNNKENPFITNEKGEATGKNPNFSIGMLTNRVEYRVTEVIGAVEHAFSELLEGMHFISLEVYNTFIEKTAAQAKATEQAEAEKAAIEQEVADKKAEAEQAPPAGEELDTPTEMVEDTVMDETPPVDETIETPTEEIVTETPVEEPVVAEETPVEEVPTPEEVTPVDDTSTIEPSVSAPSEAEPESETPIEAPSEEVAPTESAEPTGAHLIDVGGILRCNVCMLTAGSIGDEAAVAEHMAIHDGTAEPAPESEPVGGTMTTETSI